MRNRTEFRVSENIERGRRAADRGRAQPAAGAVCRRAVYSELYRDGCRYSTCSGYEPLETDTSTRRNFVHGFLRTHFFVVSFLILTYFFQQTNHCFKHSDRIQQTNLRGDISELINLRGFLTCSDSILQASIATFESLIRVEVLRQLLKVNENLRIYE